jgi:rhodanese-related sulfurtransferase
MVACCWWLVGNLWLQPLATSHIFRSIEMRIISREKLKEKLDRGDQFKLYMTLDRRAFEQSRIPGSIHLNNIAEVAANLSPEEEIVVYCANPACPSSFNAYMILCSLGYKNLYRYAGGLTDWQDAGYELVGSMVNQNRIVTLAKR